MITKDTIIGDVIKENENAVGILMSFGMGCVVVHHLKWKL